MIFVGDPLQRAALSGDVLYEHDLSPSEGRTASKQLPVGGEPKMAHFIACISQSLIILLPKI